MLLAQIPTVGQFSYILDGTYGIVFKIISQLGDSNEHHKLKFNENRPIMYFDYHKCMYTHLFWSTDNLAIYHVYI